MSIATFESPQVASQRFFPWVFDAETEFDYSDSELPELPQNPKPEVEAACQQPVALVCAPSAASGTRLGIPVRLGAVMLKLLKSYGITDEEIAEGVAAYASKMGLSQAG